MKKIILSLFLLLFCLFSLYTQVNQLWVQRYNGPVNGGDQTTDIAVDDSGNVYVTGYSYGNGTGYDYSTVKYNPEGVLQWEQRYNGVGWLNNDDFAYSIGLDGAGNVYVTGYTDEYPERFFATIKYNSAGAEQWVQKQRGPFFDGRFIRNTASLAVDVSGNVYICGGWDIGGLTNCFVTIKYNSAGEQLWKQNYWSGPNSHSLAYSIALDNSGNVYVTGDIYTNTCASDIVTIKYDPDGVQQWLQIYGCSPPEPEPYGTYQHGNSIAADVSGNVYVTGFIDEIPSFQRGYLTLKYNSNGVLQWEQIKNSADTAFSIAVDSSGNSYITGMGGTIKYNTNGVQQWMQTYPGNFITLDGFRNIYVSGLNGSDYAVIKYDTDGVQQWIKTYNGPGNGVDQTNSIALDTSGNIYVTGYSQGSGTGYDYATIKYSQTIPDRPGLIFPCGGTDVSLIPLLDWTDVYNATSYGVQVSTDSLFSSLLINANGLSVSQYAVTTPLFYNTKYYWRANAANAHGNGLWSSVCSFTTTDGLPKQVILNYPPDNSISQPVALTFNWHKANDTNIYLRTGIKTISANIFANIVSAYCFELTTDTVTFAGLIRDTTLTDTSKSITGLGYETVFFWRVKAKNEKGWGRYSVWWKFTTEQLTLHTGLVAYYPFNGSAIDSSGNGQDGIPINAILAVDGFGNPNYCYYFNGTDSYIDITHCKYFPSGTNTRTITVWFKISSPGIHSSQSILCYGSDNNGKRMQLAYSQLWDGLITEFSGGINVVQWTPDTLWHFFACVYPTGETSTDKFIHYLDGSSRSFSSPLIQTLNTDTINALIGEINTMSNEYFIGYLDDIRVYDRALSAVEILDLYQIPLPVELTYFKSTVNKNDVTLQWCTEQEVNNKGFDIQRSSDKKNWITIGFINGSGTTNEPKNYTFTDRKLSTGKYSYKLKQIDYNGNFEFFELEDAVIIGIPDKPGISQNYPNPFNPKCVIDYQLTTQCMVIIKIFDVLGREIKTLVHEKKDAGLYEIEWDGSNYPSGVYFYKLTAGSFTAVNKMVLLK